MKIRKLRLLSDFGSLAEVYGLFREKDGFPERANIVLDEDGTVIFSKVYNLSELPDIRGVVEVLRHIEVVKHSVILGGIWGGALTGGTDYGRL